MIFRSSSLYEKLDTNQNIGLKVMKKCSQYVLRFRLRLTTTEFFIREHFDTGSRRGPEAGSLKALLVEVREY